MRTTSPLPFVALLGVALTGCTKEIILDLKNEQNMVVIEAIVTEGAGPHRVKVTRSIPFEASNDFPAITNASVTLADDLGNSVELTNEGGGIYTSTALTGAQGRRYRMTTVVDGTTHTAECLMPSSVALDSVRIDSFPSFGTYTKMIVPTYRDRAGQVDHYRFVVSVNGVRSTGIYVQDDRFTDGNMVNQPLFLSDLHLKSGDRVEVTLQCIAEDVHHYFFTMAQNVSNAATPADPVSNISGGALGYFSAHSASSRNVVVP
jgi:hypothetical protein